MAKGNDVVKPWEKHHMNTPVIPLAMTMRGQSHSQKSKIGVETSSYPESVLGFRAALSPDRL